MTTMTIGTEFNRESGCLLSSDLALRAGLADARRLSTGGEIEIIYREAPGRPRRSCSRDGSLPDAVRALRRTHPEVVFELFLLRETRHD